jgi:hypothetical protein
MASRVHTGRLLKPLAPIDEGKTMSAVLQDHVRSRSLPQPSPLLERAEPAPRLVTQERQALSEYRFEREGPEASFDLESPGGYARTVSGTFAYFDAQAQTYVVREHDGGLTRVPLRDVKATHVEGDDGPGAHNWALGSGAQEFVRTFVGDR